MVMGLLVMMSIEFVSRVTPHRMHLVCQETSMPKTSVRETSAFSLHGPTGVAPQECGEAQPAVAGIKDRHINPKGVDVMALTAF